MDREPVRLCRVRNRPDMSPLLAIESEDQPFVVTAGIETVVEDRECLHTLTVRSCQRSPLLATFIAVELRRLVERTRVELPIE